jgi:hypothetical protein
VAAAKTSAPLPEACGFRLPASPRAAPESATAGVVRRSPKMAARNADLQELIEAELLVRAVCRSSRGVCLPPRWLRVGPGLLSGARSEAWRAYLFGVVRGVLTSGPTRAQAADARASECETPRRAAASAARRKALSPGRGGGPIATLHRLAVEGAHHARIFVRARVTAVATCLRADARAL